MRPVARLLRSSDADRYDIGMAFRIFQQHELITQNFYSMIKWYSHAVSVLSNRISTTQMSSIANGAVHLLIPGMQ